MENHEIIMQKAESLLFSAQKLTDEAKVLAGEVKDLIVSQPPVDETINMTFWLLLTIFVLACFVGYYVVWKVTPALQSPLMSVSNAISGIVIVGALLTAGASFFSFAKFFGLLAVFFASINIFGGFVVSQRMLAMFKKKK